jgi:hypothetical protein
LNITNLLAIVLVAIGTIAHEGISYTSRDNVVELGPLHVTVERSHTLPLPTILEAIALAGGLALLCMNSQKAR